MLCPPKLNVKLLTVRNASSHLDPNDGKAVWVSSLTVPVRQAKDFFFFCSPYGMITDSVRLGCKKNRRYGDG